MSWFSLQSSIILLFNIELWVDSFCSTWKILCDFILAFMVSIQICHMNCSPIGNVSVLSRCFRDFYFDPVFKSLTVMFVTMDLLTFVLLRVYSDSWGQNSMSFPELGMFLPSFLLVLFQLCLSFWDTNDMYIPSLL
jgi:hypothetical protein